MSALFTLPTQIPLNAGAILPGAKLYFFQTLTTTPQNTYTTDARLVAHSNPVVADANGVFEPIYLDPTLPSYRVRLTTSADVQLFQYDGIPSNQNTQQAIRLESTNPSVFWFDNDGTINSRKYRMRVAGAQFLFEVSNDNENIFDELFRATASPSSVLTLQSTAKVEDSSTSYPIAFSDSGSFTGTLTGLSTSPTVSVLYRRTGYLVLLSYAAQSATSNSTALTITGMPAAIQPSGASSGILVPVIDNGTTQLGTVSVGTNGVLTFGVGAASAAFTNPGTKGVAAGCFVYRLI